MPYSNRPISDIVPSKPPSNLRTSSRDSTTGRRVVRFALSESTFPRERLTTSPKKNNNAENAQFHWGVTPRDHWALFEVKKDPGCLNDLSTAEPERAEAMAAAYDAWWDKAYPVMVERGGDAEIVWTKVQLDLIAKKKAAKAAKQNNPDQ